jgi:hypothetical protein
LFGGSGSWDQLKPVPSTILKSWSQLVHSTEIQNRYFPFNFPGKNLQLPLHCRTKSSETFLVVVCGIYSLFWAQGGIYKHLLTLENLTVKMAIYMNMKIDSRILFVKLLNCKLWLWKISNLLEVILLNLPRKAVSKMKFCYDLFFHTTDLLWSFLSCNPLICCADFKAALLESFFRFDAFMHNFENYVGHCWVFNVYIYKSIHNILVDAKCNFWWFSCLSL